VFYERAFTDMYQAPKHMEEKLLLLNAAPPFKIGLHISFALPIYQFSSGIAACKEVGVGLAYVKHLG
jgi:hypothetical protein